MYPCPCHCTKNGFNGGHRGSSETSEDRAGSQARAEASGTKVLAVQTESGEPAQDTFGKAYQWRLLKGRNQGLWPSDRTRKTAVEKRLEDECREALRVPPRVC